MVKKHNLKKIKDLKIFLAKLKYNNLKNTLKIKLSKYKSFFFENRYNGLVLILNDSNTNYFLNTYSTQ